MDIEIRRFDKELPLPSYGTDGAAGLDCYVREDVTIEPKRIGYAMLNVSVRIPERHFILLAARGSLHKRGLTFGNGVGIIDEDYCGDGDEYRAVLYNFTNEPVEVLRGERIAQMIVLPYDKVSIREVETLGMPDRGGLGTTGL